MALLANFFVATEFFSVTVRMYVSFPKFLSSSNFTQHCPFRLVTSNPHKVAISDILILKIAALVAAD